MANRDAIRKRLDGLRRKMYEEGIDYYFIPTADFHQSEYVNDYFKVREFFSGFTGSNGNLLIWQEGAGLWTDGRYFIQAEKELDGSGITLFRMQEEGVPTLTEFLDSHLEDGQTLGFDGRVISAMDGLLFEKKLCKENRQIHFSYGQDLAGAIWENRPEFPCGAVWALPEEYAGESVTDKIISVREELMNAGADCLFLTKLDDLMWLFNIRGCDVECNPVAMSYGFLSMSQAVLFIQEKALDEKVLQHLEESGVMVQPYGMVESFLQKFAPMQRVFADKRYCSYRFYKLLKERHTIVDGNNPTEKKKAVKNPVELAHMREIFLADSVALTKFIYWLKKNVSVCHAEGKPLTEVTAADMLESFRRQIPEFLGLSFPTIAGYGANAAMMHYEAERESCAVLKPEGLLLVDSGGQYLGGTTDVTRTISLGAVDPLQRLHYTKTAIGMLSLSRARWLYGCTGRNLDLLARKPLWDIGIDYKCGTGHGVGYLLNVHEGPQNISWRYVNGRTEAVLEEGMDVTNEPGVYVEGSHGIRIENVMVVRKAQKNEYGQFMEFETLTWVPLDTNALDMTVLTEEERSMVEDYQIQVYEKIFPYLTEEERSWLKAETARKEYTEEEI